MTIRFEAELEEAVRFAVELPGDVDKYAEQFLIIVNNAREYPNEIYKVENSCSNNVYVTVPLESRFAAKDFLEWRGKILSEDKVFVCKPEYMYDRKASIYLARMFDNDKDLEDIVMLAPDDLI